MLWKATAGSHVDMLRLYDLRRRVIGCPGCTTLPYFVDEYTFMAHANDDHGYDFLKLAEMMPMSEAAW